MEEMAVRQEEEGTGPRREEMTGGPRRGGRIGVSNTSLAQVVTRIPVSCPRKGGGRKKEDKREGGERGYKRGGG